MRSSEPRLRPTMAAVALLASVAAAAGIGVPATYGAHVAVDEPQYLLTAESLGSDGDLNIADELDAEEWRTYHRTDLPEQTRALERGRRVSPHDPVLPLLLSPGVRLAGWVGAKLALAGLAGLLAALTLATAVRRCGARVGPAALVVAVFSGSAPLAVYGQQVYPELPAALAVMVAVAALLPPGERLDGRVAGRRTGGRDTPISTGAVILAGAMIVVLPWLAVKYVPIAGVLAAAALLRLWWGGRRAAAAGLAGGLLAAGLFYLAAHQALYGGWTVYAAGDHFVRRGELSAVGFAPDYLGRARRLVGLLVDRDFGLAAWQPAWLLAVPALAALGRSALGGGAAKAEPQARFRARLLVGLVAAGWLTATFVALTMHGWWFPGRQVVVILPCGVLAVAVWAGSARRLGLTAALGLIGVGTYAWLLVRGYVGALTWVVGSPEHAGPWRTLWSVLAPDGRSVALRDQALGVVWLLALMLVGWWGARAAGTETATHRTRSRRSGSAR